MVWFDTTPAGRILNRFTNDVECLDVQMSMALVQFISVRATCSSRILTIVVKVVQGVPGRSACVEETRRICEYSKILSSCTTGGGMQG